MKKITAHRPITISNGTIELQKDLARRYGKNVNPVEGKEGFYAITGDICLKSGFSGRYNGDIPKGMLHPDNITVIDLGEPPKPNVAPPPQAKKGKT